MRKDNLNISLDFSRKLLSITEQFKQFKKIIWRSIMVDRLLSINALVLYLLFVFSAGAVAQNKYKAYPVISITDDKAPNPNSKKFTCDINAVMNMKSYTTTYSDSIIYMSDVFTGQTTFYDLVSNAVPQHIVQQSWDSIHLVFMKNLTPGIPVSDRRVIYVVSTDGGANWISKGSVFGNYSAGYPYIDVLNGGRAVIGAHTELVGYPAHSVIAVDSVSLAGNFKVCDPNLMPDSGVGVWPRLVTTPSGEIPCIASINNNSSPNSYTNILSSTNNCAFSGWLPNPDINNEERYAIARASNGKIGLAYVRNNFIPANTSDIRFIESTDDGVTWSSPITIYDAQPNSSNFLGGLSGIDLVYTGNTPKVIFDLGWQTDQGTYFPAMCSKIMFWSPSINGGNPVVVADSTNTPWHSAEGPNDGFTPICRGSIGKMRGYNNVLFCTYNVSRAETFPVLNGNHYFDCYLAWSLDSGATWEGKQRLTNYFSPLRDCRFPNLSQESYWDFTYYYLSADIEYLSDSIPGFTISGAEESPAQQHYLNVHVQITGVNNNQNKLPVSYELLQNYPNPFNPVTVIKYLLPKPSYVKLTIYNALGKEIKVLVNGYVMPGDNEVSFNGEDLSSGIYFYKLEVFNGNEIVHSQTKKMVLLK